MIQIFMLLSSKPDLYDKIIRNSKKEHIKKFTEFFKNQIKVLQSELYHFFMEKGYDINIYYIIF